MLEKCILIVALLCLILAPQAALAVQGGVCYIAGHCDQTDITLVTSNENSAPKTVFFDAHAHVTDPINPCGYVWTAVYDDAVYAPDTLVPARSPVGANGIGTCQETAASPTAEVPTANTRITCSLLDVDPASNPLGPDLDNIQGELLLPFSVPVGAASFTGPMFAFESLTVVSWNGSACVAAGTVKDQFFGPPQLATAQVIGSDVDSDLDGVLDAVDNCSDVPNGFLGNTEMCDAQEDGDLDGYGNPCDFDADGDGATSVNDAIEFFAQSNIVGTDPRFDPDCDGATSINDAIAAFQSSNRVDVPGPSGLACASKCAAPAFDCTAINAPCP
jgi:hypothetical protein